MKFFAAVLILLLPFCSCRRQHTKTEIEAAMQQYDSLIQSMNAAAISKMFTPAGKLGEVAEGRDSIKKFLLSFRNVRVLSQRSLTTSVELGKDRAEQKGMYFQTAVVDGKDTLHLKGSYTTDWRWLNGEGWRIEKISTQSIQ